MSESQYLISTDPNVVLHYAMHSGNAPSDRRLRLFSCACCFLRGTSPAVVDEYEKAGAPTDDFDPEPHTDYEWAKRWTESGQNRPPLPLRAVILRDILGNPFRIRPTAKVTCGPCHGRGGWEDPEEGQFVSHLACNATGRVLAPWVTPEVTQIARDIYASRSFQLLPVLADCLEDAGLTTPSGRTISQVLLDRANAVGGGCCNRFADNQACDCLALARPESILEHLRSPLPHARGCFALDCILHPEEP